MSPLRSLLSSTATSAANAKTVMIIVTLDCEAGWML
jgi:hypothetical protein